MIRKSSFIQLFSPAVRKRFQSNCIDTPKLRSTIAILLMCLVSILALLAYGNAMYELKRLTLP